MTPAEYPMTGLTYNKDEINEIEISNNGKSFIVDLKVADTTKELGAQTVGATGNVTIDLGENYGTLVNVKFNGDEIVGASVNDENQLILPVTAFSAGAIGERTVEITMQKDKAVNLLSVKVLLATKAISTAAEFKTYITDKTATYGYFVLANDIDFKNTALALPAWYDTVNTAASNDNTIKNNVYPFFCGTFDGMGHQIKNYNTGGSLNEKGFALDGGRYGLFGAMKNAVVMNVTFVDLVHTGADYANVIAHQAVNSTVKNVIINVKTSSVGTQNKSKSGFLFGYLADSCKLKDVTVNANGQEIFNLIGVYTKRAGNPATADGNYVDCDNVVVNAKKLYYWCGTWTAVTGADSYWIPTSMKLNGATYNEAESAA